MTANNIPRTSLTVVGGSDSTVSPLILYEAACRAVAAARTVDEVKNILNRAEALRAYARQAKDRQLETDAAEIRIRSERRLGEMLREQKATIGLNKGGGEPGVGRAGHNAVPDENRIVPPTLADAGIDKKLSMRSQDLAKLPEVEFENHLTAWRSKLEAKSERITTDLLRKENANNGSVEIVKPSDNWNFAKPAFDRLADNEGDDEENKNHPHGYIPGDLYACALHYWSEPDDVVVAPMAGSGMILHVYERRDKWMKPEPWELDIHCADLKPRGPYQAKIECRDALAELPRQADLVIADIPYFGMCNGVYSDDERDLGNIVDFDAYQDALLQLAAVWANSLKPGGRAVVISSATYTDHKKQQRMMLIPALLDAFDAANLVMVDIAFASRRIQQAQNPTMARMNILARERRTMLSDMAVAMCFQAA